MSIQAKQLSPTMQNSLLFTDVG